VIDIRAETQEKKKVQGAFNFVCSMEQTKKCLKIVHECRVVELHKHKQDYLKRSDCPFLPHRIVKTLTEKLMLARKELT
jgi:hypothetical protein